MGPYRTILLRMGPRWIPLGLGRSTLEKVLLFFVPTLGSIGGKLIMVDGLFSCLLTLSLSLFFLSLLFHRNKRQLS